MRQRRPHAAEQRRDRARHPQLLALRGELQRLDAGRHELGAPRDRSETKVVGDGGQRRKELFDVRLVTGPVPAEHVGIDHDERLRHAADSR